MSSPSPKPVRCGTYSPRSRAIAQEFSSCDAQFDVCSAFIQANALRGWILEGRRYDDDGVSGERLDRPGLNRLLDDLDAGLFDRLVVHRLDRLSRKVAHFVALLERFQTSGVALSIVAWPELGASAQDALVLNLLASFAEFERELIRKRLTEARAAFKRRRRRVAGADPYGYTTDPFSKQLVPVRRESRRVLAMFERAAKGETPTEIAAHANLYGWRTKTIIASKNRHNVCPL